MRTEPPRRVSTPGTPPRPSFHLAVFALSAVAIAAAVILEHHDAALFIPGIAEPLPVGCLFRRLTGFNCPGCGLTRSFVEMAHLNVVGAFKSHWLGPVVFAGVVTQLIYRPIKLITSRKKASVAP